MFSQRVNIHRMAPPSFLSALEDLEVGHDNTAGYQRLDMGNKVWRNQKSHLRELKKHLSLGFCFLIHSPHSAIRNVYLDYAMFVSKDQMGFYRPSGGWDKTFGFPGNL